MSNNKMQQVRDALFSQLERLQDPKLPLEKEIARAQAITSVTSEIIQSARVEIEFAKATGMLAHEGFIAPGDNSLKQIGNGGKG